jgi:hypothetical protein
MIVAVTTVMESGVSYDMMRFCLFTGPSPYLGGTIGAVYFVKGNFISCGPNFFEIL